MPKLTSAWEGEDARSCLGLASQQSGLPRLQDRQSIMHLIRTVPMKLRALLIFAALSFVSPAFAQLTSTDVDTIVRHAAVRAGKISPNSVIAVTDREGYVLGVWVVRGGNANPDEIATAVSKAGTAAF